MNTRPDEVRKHRLTRADYHRMGEAGLFTEHPRVELINGVIYDRPPIGTDHRSIVNLLTERFVLAASRHAIVQVQNPVNLGDLSEPEPDISLLRRVDDYYRQTEQADSDVLLVVEVAWSTLRYDRDVKVPLYALHKIPEVWLIDVQARQLMI